MQPLSALPKVASLSLPQISATLDTAKALQGKGYFHASQAKYAEALAALSRQSDPASQQNRLLETQTLSGMRGNLPYALSSGPDNDVSDEIDGLALLDSLTPRDTTQKLSTSDSLKYLKEFQLDSTSHFDLPIQANGRVLAALVLFKERIPKHFAVWMARKGRYESMIRERFQAAGLPQDLVYLSMIESGFNPKAYSPAAASGLWQFLSSTGRRFGLHIDRYVDERRDPERATDAAVQFLSFLYNRFGDWNLAMGAYNCGEGCMDRAVKRFGQEHPAYWDLPLPAETRDYVPRIYAAAVLSKNPAAHGFNVIPWMPISSDTFTVEGGLTFAKIADALHCGTDTLTVLNPALTRRMTPPTKGSYLLKLPAGSREAFAMVYPSLEKSYSNPEPTRWVHRVHKGETVGSIAARYGVSPQDIRSWNRLDKRKLRPGRTLIIYGDPSDSRISSDDTPRRRRGQSSAADKDDVPAIATVSHRVHSGETLGSIAAKYHTTIAALRSLNGLKGKPLRAGQKIKVQSGASDKVLSKRERAEAKEGRSRKDTDRTSEKSEKSKSKSKADKADKSEKADGPTRRYRVRKGDSLYSIAHQSSTTVERIVELNGIKGKKIRPGQVLRVPTGD